MHGFFSRFLKKFPDSAHTLRRTQTLTTVGLFLAIQINGDAAIGCSDFAAIDCKGNRTQQHTANQADN